MEAYSTEMHAAVLREVRQASVLRLVELAAYYRRRQGPGLALVAAELRERQARRQINYSTFKGQPNG
ncbi:hypothetical protein [Hymenobacter baengnokdamensis]|uniref:hypothetical protein n=1 Tax=Hymenobacter baengnokdamensis TaxID=2615203 RepID=UPI0012491D23|nr:hypothetical protein [Hymenobacter baengnokdamensis]